MMKATPKTKRIPNISALGISLLEGAEIEYQDYAYHVSEDDFDEYDNDAPGDYAGVLVDVETAGRWDAGLAACRAAGIKPSSREGLLVRFRHLTGTEAAELPAETEALVAAREDREAAREEARAALAAEVADLRARVERLIAGGTVIHSGHPDQDTYWVLSRRAELRSEIVNPRYDTRPDFRLPGSGLGWSEIFRLPDGDLFVVSPTSFFVITFNPDLSAERVARTKIAAHEYDLDLWQAVYDAEIKGHLDAGVHSWLGGGFGYQRDDPRRPTHAGDNNDYGPEAVESLRAFCMDLLGKSWIARNPEAVAAIGRIQALAVPGSIRHIMNPA